MCNYSLYLLICLLLVLPHLHSQTQTSQNLLLYSQEANHYSLSLVIAPHSPAANSSSPAPNTLPSPVSIHWMSNTYCSPQLPTQYTHSSLLNHIPDSHSQALQAPFLHYQLPGYSSHQHPISSPQPR